MMKQARTGGGSLVRLSPRTTAPVRPAARSRAAAQEKINSERSVHERERALRTARSLRLTTMTKAVYSFTHRSEVQFRGKPEEHRLVLSLTAFDLSGHSEAFTRLAYRP
jgi:hypothetical protein